MATEISDRKTANIDYDTWAKLKGIQNFLFDNKKEEKTHSEIINLGLSLLMKDLGMKD